MLPKPRATTHSATAEGTLTPTKAPWPPYCSVQWESLSQALFEAERRFGFERELQHRVGYECELFEFSAAPGAGFDVVEHVRSSTTREDPERELAELLDNGITLIRVGNVVAHEASATMRAWPSFDMPVHS